MTPAQSVAHESTEPATASRRNKCPLSIFYVVGAFPMNLAGLRPEMLESGAFPETIPPVQRNAVSISKRFADETGVPPRRDLKSFTTIFEPRLFVD